MPKPLSENSAILPEIVANKQLEVIAQKAIVSPEKMLEAVQSKLLRRRQESTDAFPFERSLREKKSVHLITEIKPASPSLGVLQEKPDLKALIGIYNEYASAISVLTDWKYFQGDLALLSQVSRTSPLPALRKDFIIDAYQLHEALLSGASAVLLIVKILSDEMLEHLHEQSRNLGMTPVVECQDETELERALAIGANVLLFNNRNLSTFEISLKTTHRLTGALKQRCSQKAFKEKIIISASGIASRADIQGLLNDTHCFLIGSALMKKPQSELPGLLMELSQP